ncbi:MAG: DUF309 domain-containing protein [Dehalococcoidia bacterium]
MSPKTSERNRLPPLSDDQQRAAFAKAIAEFNAWRFYDCHETLEDVWRAAPTGARPGEPGDIADFYQGVIKVAAGLHHLLRANHKGAVNLLTDALNLLDPYRPATLGIDVDRLHDDTSDTLHRVRHLGPRRLGELDRATLPRIHREGETA